MPRDYNLGVMFRCLRHPDTLTAFARRAEAAGLDELWLVEDCFFAGGIAATTAALAATERMRVGLGIVPAPVRNAAFTAMEFAALSSLFPGRFLPGIGHGVGAWMQQIGAMPSSQLAALSEVTQAVRALLRGESVTMNGQHVKLDAVQLEFPPDVVPPLQLGVRGPKSLQVAGRVADGVISAEYCGTAYLAWARQQVRGGRPVGASGDRFRHTVYLMTAIDPTADEWTAIGAMVATALPTIKAQLQPQGLWDEVQALIDEVGRDRLAANMPDTWLHHLAAVGTAEHVAQTVTEFAATGVDSIVLVPAVIDDAQLEAVQHKLLPLLA